MLIGFGKTEDFKFILRMFAKPGDDTELHENLWNAQDLLRLPRIPTFQFGQSFVCGLFVIRLGESTLEDAISENEANRSFLKSGDRKNSVNDMFGDTKFFKLIVEPG